MARRAVPAPRPPAALVDLIDEYLEHLGSRSSRHTVDQRRSVLTRTFLPWATEHGVVTADDLSTAVLDRWSRHLQIDGGTRGRQLSPWTLQTYTLNLNLFLGWLAQHAGGDPSLEAASPSPRQRVIDVLTREEIDRIEAAASSPRDKLIIRVLADTGIRAGELLGLRPCDVIRQEGETFIRVSGKTGGRTVGITPKLYRRLRALIDAADLGEDEPLFGSRSKRGGQSAALTRSGLLQVVKYAAQEAGISKGERGGVYPHLLRHSFATWALQNGADPLILRRDLGHRSTYMLDTVYYHVAGQRRHDLLRRLIQEKG